MHYPQLYCMAGGPDSSSKNMLHKPQDNVRQLQLACLVQTCMQSEVKLEIQHWIDLKENKK